MWSAPVPMFEEDNEAELIASFVRMSALYPAYSAYEICRHIFKDLRDPELRSNQAALQWSKDLEILERIRQARLNGGTEVSSQLSKEVLEQRILATIEDTTIGYQEKKARIEGYMAVAELNGWKIKAIEKKTQDETRRFPQIIHAVYADQ